MSVRSLGEVATSCMENSLWFCSCARGIQDEENLFGIKTLRDVIRTLAINNLVPPNIATLTPLSLLTGTFYNENIFNIVLSSSERLIDNWFERKCRTFTESTIRGNHERCICILNTTDERICTKPTKDDGVRRTNSRTSQHRNRGFRNHRHVNGDAISGLNSELYKCVGGFLNIVKHLGICNGASITRFAFEVKSDALSTPFKDMAVKTVIRGVDLSAEKPFGIWRFPLQDLIPLLIPV